MSEDEGEEQEKAVTEKLTPLIKAEEDLYVELMKKATEGHAPLRDLIIRNKCFAFSQQQMAGKTGDADFYMHYFQMPDFGKEYRLYQMVLDKEQIEEQAIAGNDLDLSYYMEALSAVKCNKLLNLAKDEGLNEVTKDHPWAQKLKRQTAELEERHLWDEFWLIRMSIITAFAVETGLIYKGKEKINEFILAADKILSEEYQKGFREPVEQA